MPILRHQLWTNDDGFIVSAELILIATITVLALIVGLSEIANAVNQELEDVASAIGSFNQSFRYQGLAGHKGIKFGSYFTDHFDDCDSECDIQCTEPPRPEGPAHGHGHRSGW